MIIIDKASWQIDGGIDESDLVNHFTAVFKWLSKHDMLTRDGEDELEDGIDDTALLNDERITANGHFVFAGIL